MESAPYNIHHQVVCDCPSCHAPCIEDLGEDDDPLNMEIICPTCDTIFAVSDECLD